MPGTEQTSPRGLRHPLLRVTKGERELAVAMYKRAQNRWRAFAEYEMAN